LYTVAYPLFAHSFLELLVKGFAEEAAAFFRVLGLVGFRAEFGVIKVPAETETGVLVVTHKTIMFIRSSPSNTSTFTRMSFVN
jgi:hypothetical protein